jgi:hypothetical protein
MCAGYSGNNFICTQVAKETIAYICTRFFGRSRFVQANINNNVGDIGRSYRWFATYFWAEEISSKLSRFGLLICMVIGGQGCPQIW